jgi:hypothetical protein
MPESARDGNFLEIAAGRGQGESIQHRRQIDELSL